MFKSNRLKNSLILNIVLYLGIFAGIQLIFGLVGATELSAVSVLKQGAIGGALGAVKYYWSKNENDPPVKKKAKPVE